ncbi:hypothetical protein [Lentzea cavernae]|uniref:Uncharacterized protein n=1 Tax=Lentzea cavernae TaxID=2020703 RepID=A0ABQ3MSF7_9PSEU|nr:hypothetical protein [Lentzea cavernae]GHH57575.1 hypothetical protein GCM10017774_77320 [Lentzea cavernae]
MTEPDTGAPLVEQMAIAIYSTSLGDDLGKSVNTPYWDDLPKSGRAAWLAEAAAAFGSVVRPELERLTAESERLRQQRDNGILRHDEAFGDMLAMVKNCTGHPDSGHASHFDQIQTLRRERDEAQAAQALAEERIALTRKALRLEEKWSVQHGALAVRQERDRATEALAQQQTLLSQAREVLERVGCQFDMCTGPTSAPVDMRTCFVCEFLGRTWADGVQR